MGDKKNIDMKLSKNDYYELKSMMSADSGTVEYEKDGEILSFYYTTRVDGYIEDDYYNGTGAQIITDATCTISMIECSNENGDKCVCNLDEYMLASMVESGLVRV